MAIDFGKTAKEYLNSPGGDKIKNKQSEIEKLVDSDDGAKIKQMLEDRGGLAKQLENGDTAALQSTLQDILKTQEGARLAKQLENLMK